MGAASPRLSTLPNVHLPCYCWVLLPAAEGCPTLLNMLVVLVGGIPIAMPTVLSVTLALGAYKLAREGAIVTRMSAVEEMAGACAGGCAGGCQVVFSHITHLSALEAKAGAGHVGAPAAAAAAATSSPYTWWRVGLGEG